MSKKLYLYFFTNFFIVASFSQKYVEPFVGYKVNKSAVENNIYFINLKQIYTGIQFSNFKRKKYEYAFQLGIGLPISKKQTDSSFTLNTALPFYKPAIKTIKDFSINTSFIQKYKLFGITKVDKINILINTGLAYQHIGVSYDNDKTNYVILNPDKSLSSFGITIGFGFQYMHTLKLGRIFAQTDIAFPTIKSKNNYPTLLKTLLSYSFSIGYSIEIKNKKNEQ